MTYSKGCCRFVIAVSVMSLVEVSSAQTAHLKVSIRSMGKANGVTICVNPKDSARSTVIGVDPQKEVSNFDLKGDIIEVINLGKGGGAGVDARQGFSLGDKNGSGE